MQSPNGATAISDRNPRFPLRLVLVAAAITVSLALWGAWMEGVDAITHSVEVMRAAQTSTDAARILHLDEVLTMSARMAAATGDTAWIERYKQFGPQLDKLIKEGIPDARNEMAFQRFLYGQGKRSAGENGEGVVRAGPSGEEKRGAGRRHQSRKPARRRQHVHDEDGTTRIGSHVERPFGGDGPAISSPAIGSRRREASQTGVAGRGRARRKLIPAILRMAGTEVDLAANGRLAVDKALSAM